MKRKIVSFILMISLLVQVCGCSQKKQNETQTQGTIEDETKTASVTQAADDKDAGSVQEEVTTANTENLHIVADWAKDAVIYEVNIRQYTKEGTFQSFSKHLERLHNMGVTVLWLMPIFPISQEKRLGTLGSYYSVQDYTKVNPEFGSMEDMKALVDQAHELGFHVILDWVANHTGWDCDWITQHPDWYEQDANGNITYPQGTNWSDVASLNYKNEELRNAMIEAMGYWVDTIGVDGFRCDYAGGVPTDFWEEARAKLNQNADLFWLAEDNTNLNLLDHAFDANYNWNLYDTLKKIVKGGKKSTSIKYYLGDNYPEGTFAMNFLDNHDKNSYEGTIAENFGTEAITAMMALIYTLPGIPMLYSGDETGLDHALEFFEKDEIEWTEPIPYEALLTRLAQIRSEHAPLYSGSYGGQIQVLDTGNPYVFAFSRELNGEQIIVLLNLSKSEEQANLGACCTDSMTQLIHGQGSELLQIEEQSITKEEMTAITTLKPWEFWIISSK